MVQAVTHCHKKLNLVYVFFLIALSYTPEAAMCFLRKLFRTSANLTGFFVFGLMQEFAQLHSKFFNKPLHNRTKSDNFDHEIFLLQLLFWGVGHASVCFWCASTRLHFLACTHASCMQYIQQILLCLQSSMVAKSCFKKIQLFFCRLPLTDILEEVQYVNETIFNNGQFFVAI